MTTPQKRAKISLTCCGTRNVAPDFVRGAFPSEEIVLTRRQVKQLQLSSAFASSSIPEKTGRA